MRSSDWSSDVCSSELRARLAKAERRAADNASWKDLVEAERARRLSTIDADSKAIEAQAVADEKAQAAEQQRQQQEIGRASGREREWQYVYSPVVAVSLKQNMI